MDSYQIEFDEPSAVYSPGQNVTGKVIIRNQNALNALSLKICIHGEAVTSWRKYENKMGFDKEGRWYSYSEHINYKSKRKYLEAVSQPWSSLDGPTNKIPGGLNIFPFVFQLPFNCPPSFDGSHGNIRYSIHVELDRPWRLNVEAKRVFSVLPIIDLNMIPRAITPMIESSCKHSGFLGRKEVKVKVRIPKQGFAPGEMIPVSIHIDNHAKKPIYSVSAKLIQHVHYQAQQENSHLFPEQHCDKHCQHKTAKTTMSEVEKSIQVECCMKSQIELPLIAPQPLVPSFKTDLIEVDYEVIVDVGESEKLRCEFPLIIGTIPVGRQIPSYRSVAGSTGEAPPEYQAIIRNEMVQPSAPLFSDA